MSTIVIDVGCAKYGGDQSIPALIDQFEPQLLIGLDPSPTLDDELAVERMASGSNECTVVRLRLAAWVWGGRVGFQGSNLGGHVVELDTQNLVGCVDLASLILAVPRSHEIILKMDCEGAEYRLVPHLRERDADLRLKAAYIEWHCEACGYGIWNWDKPHPGVGCKADPEEWRRRRSDTAELLRCETGGWNL